MVDWWAKQTFSKCWTIDDTHTQGQAPKGDSVLIAPWGNITTAPISLSQVRTPIMKLGTLPAARCVVPASKMSKKYLLKLLETIQ
jgi:hypothetical protein